MASFLTLLLCQLILAPQAATATAGTLESITMHAPALEGNLLGDPADQPVMVYLPPGYHAEAQHHYATLYLLHGYNGRPRMWTDARGGMSLREIMDRLIGAGVIRPMIVVAPNGRNEYGGSFYTNSSVTGRWEDYIVRDLVSFIDGRYCTLQDPESRGIAGHSMGGYGAIMLGMKHPDVFGAVYAMSPCCLDLDADLSASNASGWRAALGVKSKDQLVEPNQISQFYVNVFIALSAAFSPDPTASPLLVRLPYRDLDGALIPD